MLASVLTSWRPSWHDWPFDGFYHMVSRYHICNALAYIFILTDEIFLHDLPHPHPPPYRHPLQVPASTHIVLFTVVSVH